MEARSSTWMRTGHASRLRLPHKRKQTRPSSKETYLPKNLNGQSSWGGASLRTTGSQLRLIPQPDGAQLAALVVLEPLTLAPKSETAFSTTLLVHSGQRIWRARLGERTSFSNLEPQCLHTYSKIGILHLCYALFQDDHLRLLFSCILYHFVCS